MKDGTAGIECASELDAALAELRISVAALARLCGVNRGTVWRWRSGQTPVPAYVGTILRQQILIRSLASSQAAADPR